jgi:hypothetical protein
MIGGVQYATARGSTKQVESAKKRISNAVTGMILLLLAYNIAFIINPATTTFSSLSVKNIKGIQIEKELAGLEGSGTYKSQPGPWTNLKSPYLEIVTAAKNNGLCEITDEFASPLGPQDPGTLPNQGNHHWYDGGANGDFTKIKMLDWSATWGTEILAPFAGTVSYTKSTSINKCGNQIVLTNENSSITICHAKDFLNANGESLPGTVTQGQVIGHVGGECCVGSKTPEGYVTSCDASGRTCTDPYSSASCSCQPIEQAGNTTGPHVHVSYTSGRSNLLSCLK